MEFGQGFIQLGGGFVRGIPGGLPGLQRGLGRVPLGLPLVPEGVPAGVPLGFPLGCPLGVPLGVGPWGAVQFLLHILQFRLQVVPEGVGVVQFRLQVVPRGIRFVQLGFRLLQLGFRLLQLGFQLLLAGGAGGEGLPGLLELGQCFLQLGLGGSLELRQPGRKAGGGGGEIAGNRGFGGGVLPQGLQEALGLVLGDLPRPQQVEHLALFLVHVMLLLSAGSGPGWRPPRPARRWPGGTAPRPFPPSPAGPAPRGAGPGPERREPRPTYF